MRPKLTLETTELNSGLSKHWFVYFTHFMHWFGESGLQNEQ